MLLKEKLRSFQRKAEALGREQMQLLQEIDEELYLHERMYDGAFPEPVEARRKELKVLRWELIQATQSTECIPTSEVFFALGFLTVGLPELRSVEVPKVAELFETGLKRAKDIL